MKKTMRLTVLLLALTAGNVMACPIGPTPCDKPNPNPADALAPASAPLATAEATNVLLQALLAEVKALRTELQIQLNTTNVTLYRVLEEQMLAKQTKPAAGATGDRMVAVDPVAHVVIHGSYKGGPAKRVWEDRIFSFSGPVSGSFCPSEFGAPATDPCNAIYVSTASGPAGIFEDRGDGQCVWRLDSVAKGASTSGRCYGIDWTATVVE